MLFSTLLEEGLSVLSPDLPTLLSDGDPGTHPGDITGGKYNPEPVTSTGGSASTIPGGAGQDTGEYQQAWHDDPNFARKAHADNILWRIADVIGSIFGGGVVTVADMATSGGESIYRGAKTIKEVSDHDYGGMGSLGSRGTNPGNPGTDWKAALDQERRIGPRDK